MAIQYGMKTQYPICDLALEERRGAASLAVTGIAPPQPYLFVKSSPIRYDFLGAANVIRYSVPRTVTDLFSAFGRF